MCQPCYVNHTDQKTALPHPTELNYLSEDFFQSLGLEHWGINEFERDTNEKNKFSEKFETSWDEYYKGMQWKRKFWSYSWKQLLKPYVRGTVFADIQGVC